MYGKRRRVLIASVRFGGPGVLAVIYKYTCARACMWGACVAGRLACVLFIPHTPNNIDKLPFVVFGCSTWARASESGGANDFSGIFKAKRIARNVLRMRDEILYSSTHSVFLLLASNLEQLAIALRRSNYGEWHVNSSTMNYMPGNAGNGLLENIYVCE